MYIYLVIRFHICVVQKNETMCCYSFVHGIKIVYIKVHLFLNIQRIRNQTSFNNEYFFWLIFTNSFRNRTLCFSVGKMLSAPFKNINNSTTRDVKFNYTFYFILVLCLNIPDLSRIML